MKRGATTVPRKGLITIPAEMVQAARFRKEDQIFCGWTSQQALLAPAHILDKAGTFAVVIFCPIKKDGTIKVPYEASQALHLSPGDTIALQAKPGRISLIPAAVMEATSL